MVPAELEGRSHHKGSGTQEPSDSTSAWPALLETSQMNWNLMHHVPLAALVQREKKQTFAIHETNAFGKEKENAELF